MSLTTFAIWFLWAALVYAIGGLIALAVYLVRSAPFSIWSFWATLTYVVNGWIALVVYVMKGASGIGKIAETKLWPECLLRRGYDGAYILFRHEPTGRFIRFRKYIREKGVYGIELTFPQSGWGQEYVPKLKVYCAENGLVLSAPDSDSKDVTTFALVDFGKDVTGAYDFARAIWTDVFGLTQRTARKCESHDLLNYDALIDSPHDLRPAPSSQNERQAHENERQLREFERQFMNPRISPLAAIYPETFVIAWFVASVGLPSATLFSLGSPPDWSIGLGSVSLGGSIAGIIFFLVYVISFGVVFLWARQRKSKRVRSYFEKILAISARLVAYGIPIAVVLIWAGV